MAVHEEYPNYGAAVAPVAISPAVGVTVGVLKNVVGLLLVVYATVTLFAWSLLSVEECHQVVRPYHVWSPGAIAVALVLLACARFTFFPSKWRSWNAHLLPVLALVLLAMNSGSLAHQWSQQGCLLITAPDYPAVVISLRSTPTIAAFACYIAAIYGCKHWVLASVVPNMAAGASVVMSVCALVYPDVSAEATAISLASGAAVGIPLSNACLLFLRVFLVPKRIPESVQRYANQVWSEGILSGAIPSDVSELMAYLTANMLSAIIACRLVVFLVGALQARVDTASGPAGSPPPLSSS